MATTPARATADRHRRTDVHRPDGRAGARRLPSWVPPALLFAALLGVWQVWVSVRHIEDFVLPTPVRIARSAVDAWPLLPDQIWATVVAAVLGMAIGAVTGVVLAALVVRYRLARRVLYPLLVVSQTIPMIVMAPLLILWFGFGLTPRVVVVVLIVFFPVLVSTVTAIDDVDRDLVDLVRSMGAGPRQVMRTVLLPAAIPGFFAGLRIAAAYAVGGAVVGELVGGDSGLGVFIQASKKSYQVDRIFVAVAIIAILTAALFLLVDAAGRWAAPWLTPDRRSRWRRRRHAAADLAGPPVAVPAAHPALADPHDPIPEDR